MKKFKEYKNLNLNLIAKEVAEFWEENSTFVRSMEDRAGAPQFVFYEGPPSANGMPGIHHVMARTLKDIFCRFQTQQGKQVFRKAGWDTHGLPVELGVEKELGITKEDIGKTISVEDYNQNCKTTVMKYTDVWNDLTKKIGYWVDLNDPYITYEPKYMETVWWLLKEIYKKKLLYKGYTIQPYSPKAGTGLSSHEINQPGTYKNVTDTTIIAQFKAKKDSTHLFDDIKEEVFFLAWTTTPWTLPSNTALAVAKDIEYVLVKTFNQYTFEIGCVILAKNLVEKVFAGKFFEAEESDFENYTSQSKKIPFQIIKSFKGKDLKGIRYEQLLPWFLPYEKAENAFQLIIGDFVTTEDGTGIVHIAPTFGADDNRVAKENDVPPMLILDENDTAIPLVDLQGKVVKNAPEQFAGKYVKNEYYDENQAPERSLDVEIAILLKTENRAFKVEKYVHNYPHCWRTDKPILYYPLDSWFVKMTSVKDDLVALNQKINWKPKATGEGRFANWLENINDWNLSRSRYWGIPLPIWRSENQNEELIIGSVEELIQEIEKSIEAGFMDKNPYEGFIANDFSEENYAKIDLHKNVVDNIILVSPSGKPMKRESDLIDVWFDSGSMPYAQLHYPFENKELIDERKAFPADFIAEGVDQTRGWFYTLHAIGTVVFGNIAYKNVISNGLVLDKNGQKMSKRLGNAIDPFKTLETYGPDATRWYMISNAQPWENLKFNLDGIDEVRRKFFGTLYNAYSFFALYANVDGFTYGEKDVNPRPEIDAWILSELNVLIKNVTDSYKDYEPTKVARMINDFVLDNLSNWYIRLCRRRFWKGEYSEDKISAYQTLYSCLDTVAKLAAPIAPFFMDRLYQDLNNITKRNTENSVHLTLFPEYREDLVNFDLIEKTHLAQQLTSMVFSLRKKENLKVRQPLQKIMIPILNEKMERNILAIADDLRQEVNVKEIQLLSREQAADLIVKTIKPNFKILGPKLGKDLKTISNELANLSSEDIQKLENEGGLKIGSYEFTLEELEIFTKDIPGWIVQTNGRLTVALDINITPELRAEGIAREFINRIQNIRKDYDFNLTDKITIALEADCPFKEDFILNKDYICSEVLATEIIFKNDLKNKLPLELDGIAFSVEVNKLL